MSVRALQITPASAQAPPAAATSIDDTGRARWDARRLLFAAFVGLCFAATCLQLAPARAQTVVDPNAVVAIREAQLCRIEGVRDTIPGAECDWKPVELPELWGSRSRTPLRDAWFKVTFQLNEIPADGLGMFAPAFNRSGRVFVNSTMLRAIGSMVEPLPLNWNRSQFIVLPASMLKKGVNELEIQQRQYRGSKGLLGELLLGPCAQTRSLWEWRVFWQNDLVEVIAAITAAIGLVMLGVWLLRRSETSYFWFGCTCGVWTVINLDYFLPYAPLPPVAWEKFVMAANVLRAAVIFMFILRYCGRRRPKLEITIWVYFVLGAAVLAVTPRTLASLSVWFLFPLIVTPYFAFLLVREGLRRSLLDGALLGLAAGTESILSWYDTWLFTAEVPESIYLAHYSTLVYVTVVGISLIRHFVSSMTGYEKQHALTLRALEEANQATQDKNLFFSMVSHELKSPLQSIITVLATEDKRAAGRERREALEKIRRAVKYMEAQIRDLFVLSAGEAAKLEMRSETFEVGELVDEVVASASDLAAGKAIEIRVTRPDDFLFVATDPKRVEQIVLNLLENAVKYTQVGSVSIAYSLESEAMLCITVADTGVGIQPEHIGKLFVPYRRFGLLDREHNSLGIGLSVVQTLLTHLGGTCAVQSTPGVGSTFSIRIPVAVEKEQTEEETSDDTVRVLIVDDRPEMLADLREVAQTLGYHVDVAASAPQASNELAVAAFDIVLIDLHMPIKNGHELASEIRRSSGPNSETCLVAVSAGSPQAQGLEASISWWPFDSFEQKPIDARAMKRIVDTRARHRP